MWNRLQHFGFSFRRYIASSLYHLIAIQRMRNVPIAVVYEEVLAFYCIICWAMSHLVAIKEFPQCYEMPEIHMLDHDMLLGIRCSQTVPEDIWGIIGHKEWLANDVLRTV